MSTSEKSTSWSYLFLHHQAARKLQKWLEAYNAAVAADDAESGETKGEAHAQPFFVHQSYRYQYKDKARERGVTKTLEPSVSGLVFLQGSVSGLQSFLRQYFPQYHLVLDRTCGRPASIEDTVMRPFMRVARTHPERVTFLRDNLERFSRDHVRLRVLTGPFAGCEGYVVRIARDRQLVFDFGGCAVAVRGVHSEEFEVAK